MASRKLFALVAGVESLISTSAETIDFLSIRVGADTLAIAQSGSGGSAKFDFGARKLGNIAAGAASGDAVEYDQFNTGLGLYIPLTQKGANNGVATLDSGGKVPVAQLPNSVMEYKGTYNASTNSPSLVDGTGNIGDVYRVTVAGSQDFGSGSLTFVVGDYVIYNGTIWEKAHSGADAVVSVNGQSGVVVLSTSDISEGSNLYFTTARVLATAITGFTSGAGTVAATDTILQAIQKLDGNTALKLDASYLSAVNDNAGSITAGQIAYVKSNGHVDLSVASSSFVAAKLAVVKDSSIATTATGSLYVQPGRAVTGSGLTPGAPVYLDPSTPGAVTQTQPSAVNEWIVELGEAVSATSWIFNPRRPIKIVS